MKLAGKTDVGSVRPENQDDYRAGELNSDAAWGLVCDGMGGARGGREASVSACDVIEHSFHEQYAQCLPGDEEKFLKRALINANRFVFQKASREEELAGMGTTAVCASCGAAALYLPRRRLPGLPRPGRQTHPAHPRPLLCAGAGGLRHHHRRGSRASPPEEHHHPGAGRGLPPRPRVHQRAGAEGRYDPALHRRPHQRPAQGKDRRDLHQGGFYDIPDRLVDAANAGAAPTTSPRCCWAWSRWR